MVIYTDGIASRQTDKNSSETRVYKYALRSREPFPEEAIKELRRANDLWNRLVDIDCDNQRRWKEAYSDVSPILQQLHQDLEHLKDAIHHAYRDLKQKRMLEQTRSAKESPAVKDAQNTIK